MYSGFVVTRIMRCICVPCGWLWVCLLGHLPQRANGSFRARAITTLRTSPRIGTITTYDTCLSRLLIIPNVTPATQKAAYICQISKQAAPNLKIAISKGARPEIAEVLHKPPAQTAQTRHKPSDTMKCPPCDRSLRIHSTLVAQAMTSGWVRPALPICTRLLAPLTLSQRT